MWNIAVSIVISRESCWTDSRVPGVLRGRGVHVTIMHFADGLRNRGEWLVHSSSHQDDVIKWKHFPRYWPFVRGIHRSPVNSTHKGQWRDALTFSLICAWINGLVYNREAGDLRRQRAHYHCNGMKCKPYCDGFIVVIVVLCGVLPLVYPYSSGSINWGNRGASEVTFRGYG